MILREKVSFSPRPSITSATCCVTSDTRATRPSALVSRPPRSSGPRLVTRTTRWRRSRTSGYPTGASSSSPPFPTDTSPTSPTRTTSACLVCSPRPSLRMCRSSMPACLPAFASTPRTSRSSPWASGNAPSPPAPTAPSTPLPMRVRT
ncbi:uncharacterized protein ACA1_102790 [Acanthamoeba castellanii str. Neff]|uniref:Uncharacterized protein n=1 Tax=Acanthamoeba castellanii (strain ATCC 30010 / Neff) TaxID=1257118 RepID=L8GZU1_ACACF|nr:uncharacterized protein ACA1_102790 [Acanthamoeba castellanii str. Neff]ELR18033.1 hypothetical protein ACA1_102790 [Acanthamoeba castellanii str. Neff]